MLAYQTVEADWVYEVFAIRPEHLPGVVVWVASAKRPGVELIKRGETPCDALMRARAGSRQWDRDMAEPGDARS